MTAPLRWPLVVVLTALAAGTGESRATLLVPLDLPDQVRRSDEIVWGRVVSIASAWNREHTRIETTVAVRVKETWKGDARRGTLREFRVRGGSFRGVSMVVPGTPRFTAEEEVVVFLRRAPGDAGLHHLVGMAQGKRHVRRSPVGPEVDAVDWGGADRVQAASLASRASRSGPEGAMPIGELRERIRTVMQTKTPIR